MTTTIKIVIITLLTVLLGCKTSLKALLFYGTVERLLIYSNPEKMNGNLILESGDYKFKMFYSDLKESLTDINKNHFYSPLDIKLPEDSIFSIIEKGDIKIINNVDTVRPFESDLDAFLDYLLRNGKMYMEKAGKPLPFIEYKHWQPQYQGTVNSQWIDNDKIIIKVTWAFVD